MFNEVTKKRSVTRSIRLEEDVDDHLQELASRNRLSMNFLANEALRRYTEWDAYAQEFGFVSFPLRLVSETLKFLTDQECKEAGRWMAHNFWREYIAFWYGKVTLDSAVKAFKLLGSDYAKLYRIEEHTEGKEHTIIVKHDLGPKWSAIFEETMKVTFNDLLHKEVMVERTEDAIIARFQVE